MKKGSRLSQFDTTFQCLLCEVVSPRFSPLVLDITEYSVFDMSQHDRMEIKLFASKMTGRILHGQTPLGYSKLYIYF